MRLVFLLVGLFSCAAVGADEVDFTLPDINGNKVSLSDYRGKWVIVNYWATWCPPCLDEIPDLVEFHEKHKDTDAVVLGVSFEEVNEDFLVDFVDSHFMSYPVLRMAPVPRTELGPVMGLPTTYIISPTGERVARQEGPITSVALEAFLERKRTQLGTAQAAPVPVPVPIELAATNR
jgi:thiol-disulfide isomerase/thioredoxin